MGGRPGREDVADRAQDVVAFVVITSAMGTNGDPPRGQIRIEETLRGELACGTREATFPPPSDEGWYAIRGGGEAGLAKYNATPRGGPQVGARIVAVVYLQPDGSLSIDSWASWPDSDEQRSRVRNGAKP